MILWVNEAEVSEEVIAERIQLQAVLKRTFRVSANASLVHRRRKGYIKTVRRYGLRALVRYVGGVLHMLRGLTMWATPGKSAAGQKKILYGLKHLCAATGFLVGFTHWQPSPYKVIDGH